MVMLGFRGKNEGRDSRSGVSHAGLAFLVGAVLLLASCASESTQPKETAAPPPQPVKILALYPGQEAVAPGDQAQVCYGVENATSVRFEPPVTEIRPLTSKCVWFEPKGSLELTLIAVGGDGQELRETIPISVRAGAAPTTTIAKQKAPQSGLIETFVATSSSISPGGASTICYVLREPAKVTLEPSSGDLGDDLRKCVLVRPTKTTSYTLRAAAGSSTDTAKVTIKVE